VDILFKSEFWFAVIRSTTPVLFATLAANLASKSGIINIAIEGTMLIAALVGVVTSAFTNSLLLGLFFGLLSGVLVTLALSYFSLKLKSNILITGIAINLAASGGTVLALYTITGDKSVSTVLKSAVFPTVNIPILRSIPFVGNILSGHNLLTYVALISVGVIYLLLYKTPLGTRIRAVGESEAAAESVGININKTKTIAIVLSGMFSALGGMFLSMGYLSMFTAGMTSGRGFVALATDAMSGSNPIGGLFSSLIYGFSDSLANYLQNTSIPLQFIQTFPYIFIVVAFTVFSYIKKLKNKAEDSI